MHMTGTIRTIGVLAANILCLSAQAQDAFTYKIGNTSFEETAEHITIETLPNLRAAILPGGHTWPPLSLDLTGQVYLGPAVINAATGKASGLPSPGGAAAQLRYPYGLSITPTATGFVFEKGGCRCVLPSRAFGLAPGRTPVDSLKYRNLNITSSDTKVLALITTLGLNKEHTRYQVGEVDLGKCRFSGITKLGNPDLLVELGWSREGGWWITGSIEQTLLRSADGKAWKKFTLPAGVSSLTSAFVEDDKNIWLAAGLGGTQPDVYYLAHTANGGQTWSALQRNDPRLQRIPATWLDGIRRYAEMRAE